LIDTGAQISLIHPRLIDKYKIPTISLPRPIPVRNVDGTMNKGGTIEKRVEGNLLIGGLSMPTNLYVANTGSNDVILGLPFLRETQPTFYWETEQMKWNNKVIEDLRKKREEQEKNPP
ncbi:hypothetical protein CERSUDRAFT_25706, partial [Gelatoporia subvermispora B]